MSTDTIYETKYVVPKRRAKVACDECHSRRVKCSGDRPCTGCRQIGIDCTFMRPRDRRGGASLKQRTNYIYRRQLKASERAAAAMSSSASASPSSLGSLVPISSILNEVQTIEPWEQVSNIRYPILLPVLPALHGIMSSETACTLLETYFSRSPWGTSYLVRRASFLTTDPARLRKTKPTLLFAMLCFASQYHLGTRFHLLDIPRGNMTDRLFMLAAKSVVSLSNLEDEATLDDVLSDIHLSCILSGSKYQKKSIEWWSATYQLARQLRLNEEFAHFSEEEKEERRRTWWLLYCTDRHQAISVRKPLSFRDAECHELRRPCKESLWSGTDGAFEGQSSPDSVTVGISYRVTDCSFFGLMLPLMSIFGEVTELYNLEENIQNIDLGPKRAIIQDHLDIYDDSLSDCTKLGFEEAERYMHYARHFLGTLHILFSGKWDPLDMLADVEACGLSPQVIYSAAMATIAANTIKDIQRLDPQFEFMPMFFGMFILQCSFPLLLVMKTLGMQSDENIIGACENILEAYTIFSGCSEGTVIDQFDPTNPYWPNFASITNEIKTSKRQPTTSPEMALQMMQDIHTKTREILGIYRWNKTGHGLNP